MPSTQLLADSTTRCVDAMHLLRAGRSDPVEIGDIDTAEASAVATSQTLIRPAVGEITERFDPIACLDDCVRQTGRPAEPVEPGRYIEIQGPDRTLLIVLGADVTHIGRGLTADLHLDDSSVSRRHAVLVPRPSGPRILDDRSSNGTFVNGLRIEQFDLRNGDVIGLGRVVLRYLEV
jgi:FHA domain